MGKAWWRSARRSWRSVNRRTRFIRAETLHGRVMVRGPEAHTVRGGDGRFARGFPHTPLRPAGFFVSTCAGMAFAVFENRARLTTRRLGGSSSRWERSRARGMPGGCSPRAAWRHPPNLPYVAVLCPLPRPLQGIEQRVPRVLPAPAPGPGAGYPLGVASWRPEVRALSGANKEADNRSRGKAVVVLHVVPCATLPRLPPAPSPMPCRRLSSPPANAPTSRRTLRPAPEG